MPHFDLLLLCVSCAAFIVHAQGTLVTSGAFRGSPLLSAGNVSDAQSILNSQLTNLTGSPSSVVVSQQTTSVLSVVHYFKSVSRSTLDATAVQTTTLDAVSTATKSAGFNGSYSTVYLSDECMFDDTPFPTSDELYPGSLSCPQSVTLTFTLALEAPAATVMRSVCQVLPSCSNVSVSTTFTSATVVIGEADPIQSVTIVRNALSRPSGMTVLQVVTMKADGYTVFTSKTTTQTEERGTVASCASKMWWLVFLILLLPVMYLLFKYAYRSGIAAGVKKADTQHREEQEKLTALQNTYQPQMGMPRPPQQWEQWQEQFRSQNQTAS